MKTWYILLQNFLFAKYKFRLLHLKAYTLWLRQQIEISNFRYQTCEFKLKRFHETNKSISKASVIIHEVEVVVSLSIF